MEDTKSSQILFSFLIYKFFEEQTVTGGYFRFCYPGCEKGDIRQNFPFSDTACRDLR